MIRIFLLVVGNALALWLALLALQTAHDNRLGWFMFAVGLAYMAGGVFTLWPHDDQEDPTIPGAGDRSIWSVVPGFVAASFGPLLEYRHLPPLLARGPGMQFAGLAIIALGLFLLVWARLAGREVPLRHPRSRGRTVLVTGGPYGSVRHPGYASIVLLALGISIGYSSVIGLVAVPLLLLPGLAYRIHVEERRLLGTFGEEYRGYSRTTKALIPGIW